jgi:hypothetical protein
VHGGPLTQVTNTPRDSIQASWAPAVTLCTVPKLKGKTLAAAKKLVKRAGCVLGSVGGPKANRSGLIGEVADCRNGLLWEASSSCVRPGADRSLRAHATPDFIEAT